ncbi:hypothetical protein HZS_3874 [Henneguya salminicola]|nr:hypothetical protein HZS_3874 [Henneguya salminicola]
MVGWIRGQKDVIIEDLHSMISATLLKSLLDEYPVLLEIKGGMLVAKYTKIVINSNYDVDHLWEHSRADNILAIKRHNVD